jgi:chromosome segregation ATPase
MGLFKKAAAQPETQEYTLGANTKALFGYSAEEAPVWQLSADQVTRFDAAETELTETVAAIDEHDKAIKTANDTIASLQATEKTNSEKITALEADKTALNAKLDADPAATVTRVTKEADNVEGTPAPEANEFLTSVDAELKQLRAD